MEYTGMGEVASPKGLDAGNELNDLLKFSNSGEDMYDRYINPKFKVCFHVIHIFGVAFLGRMFYKKIKKISIFWLKLNICMLESFII